MKAFRINVNRCNGCHSCQIACKDEHVGNDWAPYAKPQPEWGQFWGKLLIFERGSVGEGLPENPFIRMSSTTRSDYVFMPVNIVRMLHVFQHVHHLLFQRGMTDWSG